MMTYLAYYQEPITMENEKNTLIPIRENLHLELIQENHAEPIFRMVNENRNHLRLWLSFVDAMQEPAFAKAFVKGSIQRNLGGQEFAFVMIHQGQMVGRIGVYKLDAFHRQGEIGYWLIESAQGQGMMQDACRALNRFCFDQLGLNRLEIRCGTENIRSQRIPESLGFTREARLRQAEWLHGRFIDLYLYSLLKSDPII